MTFRRASIAALLLVAAPSASIVAQTVGQTGPQTGDAASDAPVYRLAPDDRLRITVFGEPDLTGPFTVGSDGNLSFPLIGNVKASGLTIGELQAALTSRLGAKYLKNPKVAAELVDYRPFYILGEVNKPGQYPYRSGISVVAAVATAGGFTYRANHKTVAIKHVGRPGEEKVKLGADLLVQPGDTIRVLERFF